MPFQGGNKNFRQGPSGGGGGVGGGGVPPPTAPGGPPGPARSGAGTGSNFHPMGNGAPVNKWANNRGLATQGKAR